jgi:hypothetical protein
LNPLAGCCYCFGNRFSLVENGRYKGAGISAFGLSVDYGKLGQLATLLADGLVFYVFSFKIICWNQWPKYEITSACDF